MWAIVIMIVALGLAAANVLPIAEATMAGASGILSVSCLTMDEAYQSIEWRAYAKMDTPMTALLFVVVLVCLPIFWPLK